MTITNPLLTRVKLPGQTIRLPSGGNYYGNGELADTVQNGEIHIYPMTALNEIVMRSPDKIINGEAITEVFATCVPDVLQPHRLLMRDLDYILMALRQTTYGDSHDIEFEHNCENAKVHTYQVSIPSLMHQTTEYDPEMMEANRHVTMPNGQVVTLRPAAILEDVVAILSETNISEQELMSVEYMKMQRLRSVAAMVDRVEDVSDRGMITEWLGQIPVTWFETISHGIDKMSGWGPNTEMTFTCKDCGEAIKIDVPLNPIVFFS